MLLLKKLRLQAEECARMGGERAKAPVMRDDGLQLEEHRAFQEHFWSAQRVAWVVFGLFLVAAMLGLTGAGGPLSRSLVPLGDGAIDYPRIARWQAAEQLVLRLAPGPEQRTLRLSPDFTGTLQVDSIYPEPARSVTGPDGTRLTFDTVAGAEAEVQIGISPLQPGYTSFAVAVDDGTPRTLDMFVLP